MESQNRLVRLMGRRARVTLSAALAVAVVGGGLTVASLAFASTTSTSTLTACQGHEGNLRLVSGASDCRRGETAVQWNVTGPTGPQGVAGPQGPTGPQGPVGPAGPASTPGSNVVGTFTFTPASGASAGTPVAVNMYSFSASAQQALNIGSQSSGAGAGKITFSPATMTIPVGPGSMALLDAFNAGDHFATATVVLNSSNGTPVETITLTLVVVSALTTVSDGSGTTPPQMQVSLEYGGSQYALSTN